MTKVHHNHTEVEATGSEEITLREAFLEFGKTIDCDKIKTLQLEDGTIVTEGTDPYGKFESFVHSFPRIQIEGICDGPAEFKIGKILGEGGMSVVRQAQQLSLDRPVAIKTPRTDAVEHAHIINLLREAWLTGALEHPNIIPVYVLGRDDNDLPVFVMKRIEGVSWKRLLDEPDHPLIRGTGRDPLGWHLEIFMRVCEAVHFAHSRGIIHRDIKPDNVMIGSFGEVYLLDWGVAVSLRDDAGGRFPLARDIHGIAGTPEYMAPEMVEMRGSQVDQRTDIYLLGSLLYEIVSGQPPHQGQTLMETLWKAFSSETPVFSKEVPDELVDICKQAMSRVPNGRYQSAEEMRRAVADFLTHRSSLQLTEQALVKLSELQGIVDSCKDTEDEALKQSIYRVFGESRFGFEQSLKIWEGNQRARAGLNGVLRHMVTYELSRKRADAAEALLAEMTDRYPDLDKQLEALKEKLSLEQQEIENLRKMHTEIDIRVAYKTRGTVAITFAVLFPLIEFLFGYLERTGALVSLYLGCITSTLIFMAICNTFIFGWMRNLLQNAVNRRVIIAMNIAFLSSILIMAFGWLTGVRFNLAISVEMMGYAIVLSLLGIFVERRLLIGTGLYLLFSIGPALFESYTHEIVGVANMMVFGTIALIWWPYRKPAHGEPHS